MGEELFEILQMRQKLFFISLNRLTAFTARRNPFSPSVSGEVQRFLGNVSAVDNFKIMEVDENFLLLGATWVNPLTIFPFCASMEVFARIEMNGTFNRIFAQLLIDK
jgi:hypothetical protein